MEGIEITSASDMETAMFLARHIDNPCVDRITGKNIRYIYINLAKNAIEEFINPYAREFLEMRIKQYSSNNSTT